ncbi:MAG: transcription initiation factor IIB, partial [Candidatus Aenigmarchaeota archaeon]|nr:transcription initiation factor IIB [Candidatus Aenigmarchaeota archaeon]
MTQDSLTYHKGHKCPDHGYECLSSRIYDHNTGEEICGLSGVVLSEKGLDTGPEWHAFNQEEKLSRSRVGIPTTYTRHDKGLSTGISPFNYDAFGRKLPLPTRQQMYRLRKWQKRSTVHSSVDRNLAQAMSELDRLSDKVYIPPPIKEKAAITYRKFLDKGLVRGRSIAAIAAAALYSACRGSGTPRTLREIAEASLVDKKDVARCYRLLLWELEMKMPLANPQTYVSKIAENTGISGKSQGIATQILRNARKMRGTAGKDPMGLAAAALYIGCLQNNEKKTQKDIAEAAGVTEVTVRNRYKTLKRTLNLQ